MYTFRVLACVLCIAPISGYCPSIGTLRSGSVSVATRSKSTFVPTFARSTKFGLRTIASPALESEPSATVVDAPFACPQCGTPTDLKEASCSNCGAPFKVSPDGFVDLTPEATTPPAKTEKTEASTPLAEAIAILRQNPIITSTLASYGIGGSKTPFRQELFRTPLVSFLYERGWRAGFASAGFPGIEKEYELVMDFFAGAQNKTVMDLSCGSGLMVRRLAKSGAFSRVIALDYSEAMLKEVQTRKKEEGCPEFELIRGDVGRLPFQDESIDAIHSGAAVHCWPSVQDGLRQVHRVLKPGGLFFATTFLWGAPDELVNLQRSLAAGGGAAAYRFFNVEELEWLMKGAGFASVQVERRQRCAIIRCTKAL